MAIKRVKLGDSGVASFGSNGPSRTTEHILELQGRNGSMIYRQMSKSDEQIGMILKAHKNPIRSCSWDIVMPDDANEQEKKCIGL
ncbi:MAG: hypothetical protein JNN05_04570, partial [Candidatus Omnitrophica bacterium]|nr:hypothetical protein [Candidatus Omnitrophota bacterium]